MRKTIAEQGEKLRESCWRNKEGYLVAVLLSGASAKR